MADKYFDAEAEVEGGNNAEEAEKLEGYTSSDDDFIVAESDDEGDDAGKHQALNTERQQAEDAHTVKQYLKTLKARAAAREEQGDNDDEEDGGFENVQAQKASVSAEEIAERVRGQAVGDKRKAAEEDKQETEKEQENAAVRKRQRVIHFPIPQDDSVLVLHIHSISAFVSVLKRLARLNAVVQVRIFTKRLREEVGTRIVNGLRMVAIPEGSQWEAIDFECDVEIGYTARHERQSAKAIEFYISPPDLLKSVNAVTDNAESLVMRCKDDSFAQFYIEPQYEMAVDMETDAKYHTLEPTKISDIHSNVMQELAELPHCVNIDKDAIQTIVKSANDMNAVFVEFHYCLAERGDYQFKLLSMRYNSSSNSVRRRVLVVEKFVPDEEGSEEGDWVPVTDRQSIPEFPQESEYDTVWEGSLRCKYLHSMIHPSLGSVYTFCIGGRGGRVLYIQEVNDEPHISAISMIGVKQETEE